MASYGTTSRKRLEHVHGDLVRLLTAVVEHYDNQINYNGGFRPKHVQNDLFPTYTKTQWPYSKHNCMLYNPALNEWEPCSLGVDAMPYYAFQQPHVDWNDKEGFYHFAGFVRGKATELNIPIVWGGDWDGDYDLDDQDFYDLAHFNLDVSVDPYKSIWEEHLGKYSETF
jgi:peptidoglycan L-alanyl-D-glutamate endopeptidase CwlK